MIHVPDYRLEPEEPKVMFYCDKCEEPIYYGDVYFELDDQRLCPDCIELSLRWAGYETV